MITLGTGSNDVLFGDRGRRSTLTGSRPYGDKGRRLPFARSLPLACDT